MVIKRKKLPLTCNDISIVFWHILIMSAIWQSGLSIFEISGIGNVYLFRVVILLSTAFIFHTYLLFPKRNIYYINILCLGGIFCISILSLFWSQYLITSVNKILNNIFIAIFIFELLMNSTNKRVVNNILIAIAINLSVICLIGIYEIFTGHYIFYGEYYFRTDIGLNYPIVSFANTNDLAGILILFYPIIIAMLTNKKSRYCSILCIVYTLINIIVIIGSCARLGYIIVIIYAIYYILTAKNLILKAFFSLVSILSLITLFITSLGKLIWEQLFSVIDSILSGAIFSDIRVEIIIKGIRSLEQSFWFGHGAGTSEYVIEKSYTKYVTTSAPHNLLLELGVEYGLVGAILLIFFFLFLFNQLYNNRKLCSSNRDALSYNSAAMLGIMVFPIVSCMSASFTSYISFWLWFGTVSIIALRQSNIPLIEH